MNFMQNMLRIARKIRGIFFPPPPVEYEIFLEKFYMKFKNPNFWPAGIYDINKMELSKHSYGRLNLAYVDSGILKIGKCCSIAEDVVFLLGGHHPYQTVSTFPFNVYYSEKTKKNTKDIFKNLDIEKLKDEESITVNDDVWIGHKAFILPGITIGQGAIVGACAVVTKDVPPYSIVAGNPARIVKYRFNENIIKELLSFADYSKLTEEKVMKYMDFLLTEPLTEENIDKFREIFD
ncbi:CatB-related O-acetyltransferase [Treponema denticola]|uniref:CatB-related O-acetyltransferase n=2 Tax=Treponema denticola TaxID=158 RepID=UPI003D917B81